MMQKTRGVLVAGVQPRCGKTVACAGLSAVLQQVGFRVQAIKPMAFHPEVSIRAGQEQAYFDRIAPPLQQVRPFSCPSPFAVGKQDWHRYQEMLRQMVYPYLLEAPVSYVASPVRAEDIDMIDVTALARLLDIPLLLVAPKQPDLIGCVAPAMTYLQQQGTEVLGWVMVETQPLEAEAVKFADIDFQALYLARQFRVPYLGEIAYSPSISVEAMQQGNLIRITEAGLDLLPIQQALEVAIP